MAPATMVSARFPTALVAFHADGAWTVHCGGGDGFDDDVVGWMEA